ncbi:MAG TPA: hypothetical protein VIV06_06400, partial [Candidatus Limnocylindrales bacterium]
MHERLGRRRNARHGDAGDRGEPVTLEFWAHSGWNKDYYDALIQAFEAKYPNIKVDMTLYP